MTNAVTEQHKSPETATDLAATRPAALTITGLTKTFERADGTVITPVDDVSLTIAEGEFFVLLGPSGCGKTTLLRCIAGLESPDRGLIDIRGTRVVAISDRDRVDVPPEKRGLGMIFQSYALWPHMTVEQNIGYPLESLGVAKQERAGRIARAMELVGVAELGGQVPGRLSGGQQQRVSLARALVAEPDVILFDEPLSNVDAKVREELRVQLIEMQQRVGFTAIYVTHDQIEAMELADRIAVLRQGRVAQLDEPGVLYERPASRYVATFIGSANELPGVVTSRGDGWLELDVAGAGPVRVAAPESPAPLAPGDEVVLIWRPERTTVGVAAAGGGAAIAITGQFVFSRFLGAYSELVVQTSEGDEVRVVTSQRLEMPRGSTVEVTVDASHVRVYATEGAR